MCFSFRSFSNYYVKQFYPIGFLLSHKLKTENKTSEFSTVTKESDSKPTNVYAAVLIQACSPLGNEMNKWKIMVYFTRVAFPRDSDHHSSTSHNFDIKNNVEHNFWVIIGDDIIIGIMKYQNISKYISIMWLRS